MRENLIQYGFYPDPSVCRADDCYYMVHSSFAYAPGLPVFVSEDMRNWKQIGHVLETEEQLQLTGAGVSEGLFAPTIRYHQGTFYVIVTNMPSGVNFYVTAERAEGPWSLPVPLKGAEGIDPSLYFENEKCYYIGQRTKKNASYNGDCEIWIQELDLAKKELVGENVAVWDGAMKHAIWPEGPHLFKRGEYYYINIAEGGTEHEHSVCVARSRNIFGPYESCKNNPIFTHRHLGRQYPIQNVGHADFVETADGIWYAVMLGTRPLENKNELGRETFLAEVIWEDDWPVIAPGEGRLYHDESVEKSFLNQDILWEKEMNIQCVMLRRKLSLGTEYRMEEGKLCLKCKEEEMSGRGVPTFVGVRERERCYTCETELSFCPEGVEEAGLVQFFDEDNYLLFVLKQEAGRYYAEVRKREKGQETELARIETEGTDHVFTINSEYRRAAYKIDGNPVLSGVNLDWMTTEHAGGFVGAVIGVYAFGKETEGREAVFGTLSVHYR